MALLSIPEARADTLCWMRWRRCSELRVSGFRLFSWRVRPTAGLPANSSPSWAYSGVTKRQGFTFSVISNILELRLRRPQSPAILLPGAEGILQELADSEDVHLGLLTGNLKAGAEIKLRQFGVWHHFISGAFADDAEDRNLLGPFALERMQEATGARYSRDEIFVIGDTPKDIACAHAFGARCIAVTTGSYDRASLEPHQPWAILDSLAGRGLHQLL
jgi:phosphoglycolate phosphatase-like HAD superfamily hydrolase